jgi:hypothetical protein
MSVDERLPASEPHAAGGSRCSPFGDMRSTDSSTVRVVFSGTFGERRSFTRSLRSSRTYDQTHGLQS